MSHLWECLFLKGRFNKLQWPYFRHVICCFFKAWRLHVPAGAHPAGPPWLGALVDGGARAYDSHMRMSVRPEQLGLFAKIVLSSITPRLACAYHGEPLV